MISLFNPSIDNIEAASTFISKIPAGLSVRAAEHAAQFHENRRFQDFDFGPDENMERYGNYTPPIFDISQISGIPIALFFAGTDDEVGPTDDQWVISQLEDVTVYSTYYPQYFHFDFYLAENNEPFLEDVVELLSEYNNGYLM